MKKKTDVVEISKREVIRVKAKKYDDGDRAELKKFSIDPDITTFQILRELLITAFDIKCDFIISYWVRGSRDSDDRYLPMLSEWDLNTAIYGASDPVLTLKVDLKAGLDEWDIIDEDDLLSGCIGETSTNDRANGEMTNSNERTLTASVGHLLHKSLFGDVSQQSSGMLDSKTCFLEYGEKARTKCSVNEVAFRSYLDAEGRLLRVDSLRLAVYQGGLESSLRPTVWKHLLNVYPSSLTEEERRVFFTNLKEKYCLLRDVVLRRFKTGRISEELRLVANAVRKDVIRTDRTLPFFSGNEDENKNLLSLFNLLTTYALAHPEVSYCQGMSDLASPLLVVMQDESEAYICFCALMLRMKRNFSCDGRAMTRKFSHLSELLQYYDPTFSEYLHEIHADDLLFCYRWLLLELKREFSFDDSLRLMEVMWASLPETQMQKAPLTLFDVDLTACEDYDCISPASIDKHTFYGRMQCKLEVADQLNSSRRNTLLGSISPDSDTDDEDDGGAFERKPLCAAKRYRPMSVSSTRSCPVNVTANVSGICPAAVVRSLMLHESENARLHALRHASYPPKTVCDILRVRQKRRQPRFTIGSGPDEELTNELNKIITDAERLSSKSSRSVENLNSEDNVRTVDVGSCEIQETESEELQRRVKAKARQSMSSKSVGGDENGKSKTKDPKRRYTMDEKIVYHKKPTYLVRASTELAVTDQERGRSADILTAFDSIREHSPVPVAQDASLEEAVEATNGYLTRQMTLTEIHDICLMQSLTTCVPSSTSSPEETETSGSEFRSRQPSGGGVIASTNGQNVVATKSRHASSSGNGGGGATTNFDSGFSDTSNVTGQYVSSTDVTSRGDSTNEDTLDFAMSMERDSRVTLPQPTILGDGNPFMMFVCLTLLLQHRDTIMKRRMDFNEIAIHFDKLMKKHKVTKVLKRARVLFADYLKSAFLERSGSLEKDLLF